MSQLVDRILALHADDQRFAKFGIYTCKECQKSQPCPTIRTVEGEHALARSRECQVQMYEGEEILVRRRDGGGWRQPGIPKKPTTYHWVSATEAVR